jgi:sporulation protein YlmC with PRC-barrel domain
MPHYGTLRETKFQQDPDDLRGAVVYGVKDEKLGKIEDVIFDHASGDIRYVVVETGGLFSKKNFLVPANRVSPYGNHEDKFYAELDKERIQMLPEYDETALKSDSNWSEYEKRYEDQWKDGALMYNTSTGRMITPPPEQVSGTRTEGLSSEGRASLKRDLTPQRLGREDDPLGVGNSRSATLQPRKPSIAGAEDAIESDRASNAGRKNIVEVDDTMLRERERLADTRFDDSRTSKDTSLGKQISDKLRRAEEEARVRTPRAGEREGDVVAEREGLTDPGVYRVDKVPEAEKRSDMNEPLNANYGPRWNKFQSRLRERRADVVGECPICGSQKKVA